MAGVKGQFTEENYLVEIYFPTFKYRLYFLINQKQFVYERPIIQNIERGKDLHHVDVHFSCLEISNIKTVCYQYFVTVSFLIHVSLLRVQPEGETHHLDSGTAGAGYFE